MASQIAVEWSYIEDTIDDVEYKLNAIIYSQEPC